MHDFCFIGAMIGSFLFLRCSFPHLFKYILKSEIFLWLKATYFTFVTIAGSYMGTLFPFHFWLQNSIPAQPSQTCRRDVWEMCFFAPLNPPPSLLSKRLEGLMGGPGNGGWGFLERVAVSWEEVLRALSSDLKSLFWPRFPEVRER